MVAMNSTPSFSHVIVGDDQLSIMCAETLLARNQKIVAFISNFTPAIQWANHKKIPSYPDPDIFLANLTANIRVDFLFSIINHHKLSATFIHSATQLAINYHDALLPKYAGVHATSWALLNEETEHGITWHSMADKVDTGDILLQEKFLIEKNETAFSLNLKCHQLALLTFEKLLDGLIQGNITPKPQNLSKRTYYGRYHALPQNGIINWHAQGEDIDKLCRSLDFGNHKNTLGSAKLLINKECYVISKHELQPKSGQNPGEVSQCNNLYIQIATLSKDIRLIEIKNSSGQSVPIPTLIRKHHIKKGSLLVSDDLCRANNLVDITKIAKYEDFWLQQFSQVAPLTIPFSEYFNKKNPTNFQATAYQTIENNTLTQLFNFHQQQSASETLLATLLTFFYRLNNHEQFSIWFRHPQLNQFFPQSCSPLFSQYIPLNINLDSEDIFAHALTKIQNHYKEITQHVTFQNDFFCRYPDINKPHFPISITIIEDETDIQPSESGITITISKQSIQIHYIENLKNAVCQIISYFNNFTKSLLENPNKKIKEHTLLDSKEYKKIIFDWNQTQQIYPEKKLIHELFEEQVEKFPNKLAIIFEDEKFTYAELNQQINQLAHHITTLTKKTNCHIIIYQNRHVKNIISMLATLKSGNVYVPINPDSPLGQLHDIIIDCQPEIILTQASLAINVENFSSATNAHIIKVDTDWPTITSQNSNNPKSTSRNQKAYVIYTSGSTGKPKGVEITQRALVNLLSSMGHEINFTAKEIWLAITPITFDISGLEIYLPLITGAHLVFANNHIRFNPEKIASTIIDFKVTFMFATPATWQILATIGWKNETKMNMLCGGEGLNTQLATQLCFKQTNLWNLYGPSETTILSTAYKVEKINHKYLLVPIGKPIANTQVYVLDKNLQPLPILIWGELYISGAGVAAGYLNNPELTNKSFIANPFSKDTSAIMYKTGDIARWLPDGNLEYLGRIDNQIKIRGLRVELGEIETCLLNYPGIKQAVVIGDLRGPDKSKLVAYLVCHEPPIFSREQLIIYLKTRLYEHMVPSYFIMLDSLPLNANGKIDKKALPQPTTQDLHYPHKLIMPTNDEERLLVEIWSSVLSIPVQEIGTNDDFFRLGGHSLLAVQVISRISALFFVKLDIRSLFKYPTIKQLATLVQAAKKTESPIPLLSSVKESQPQLLAYNQMRLWFLNEFHSNSAVYNIAVAWRLRGELDDNALKKAITDLIHRQGVFRSIFLSANGKAKQILLPISSISFDLEIKKLADTSIEGIQKQLQLLAAEPFKLNHGKLFSFQLLELGDNDNILFICLHHLIADGWSLGILYRELSLLYRAHFNDVDANLPPLSLQYIDYTAWQHKIYNDASYRGQIKYWKKQLKDLQPLELPTDFNRPAIQTYNGNTIHFHIPTTVTETLRSVAQEHHTTLFTILISTFIILLKKYTNQTDIAVGIPIANRNMPIIENIIGFFVNMLVIRLQLSANPKFIELLHTTQNTILDAYANGDVPFERIIDALQPERDQSHSPLFQVVFAFNNTTPDTLNFPNVTAQQLEIKKSYAQQEFSCFLEEKSELISGYIEYNADLFSADSIQRFIENYLVLLAGLDKNLQQKIDKMPILSTAEKKLLLINWNATKKNYPENTNLVQCIEEQVANNPQKTAIIYQNKHITYDELNKKANQLAHFLKKTTHCKSYVAVYLDRSVETIICFLAIMKSDNIYIPIDQDAPLSVTERILTDAKVSAILTKKNYAENARKLGDQVDAEIIAIDEQANLINQEACTNLDSFPSAHLAYVLYTSGTTGKPKGVQITHKALVNFLWAMRDEISFTASDILLAITPVTFDISGLEIYLPLITGAYFVLAENATRFNPQLLAQNITAYNVTVMQGTPATWQMLINIGWRNERQIKMLCGGEGLSTPLAMQLHANNAPLWNLYGPTETTIWSTCHKVNTIDPSKPLISIGLPLANTRIYILDSNMQPTPIGVPGELYIGGDGVGQGYLNNPKLTQLRFIPDKFAAQPGKKMYKTGDIALWSSSGEIYYIGRADSQIKIRGYRIEAEAIENILEQHADIAECVISDKSPTQDHELVAYVVLKHQSISLINLREYLQQHLPGYMIPSKFFAITKLPLTASGKIDRNAVPNLTNMQSLHVPDTTNTVIQNEYEQIVIDIIKRSLRLGTVDPLSNFFDIGMHSLLLVEFSYAISKALNRDVNVTEIFTYPTVRSLISFLTKDKNIDDKIIKQNEDISVAQRVQAQRSRLAIKKRVDNNAS